MKILESRPEQIICLDDDGQITTRSTSPYYKVKFFKYNDKRINYIFSDKMYVMETFDDRIFNCWCNGQRFQFRQDLADRLSMIILKEMNDEGLGLFYQQLFEEAVSEVPYWEILETYLGNVSEKSLRFIRGEGYIIHDSFLIDFHGNAWQVADSKFDNTDAKKVDGKVWRGICIVMKGPEYTKSASETKLPFPDGSFAAVNSLTMTILSKVLFLLNPNMKDDVFVNQLPNQLKIKLDRLRGGEIE